MLSTGSTHGAGVIVQSSGLGYSSSNPDWGVFHSPSRSKLSERAGSKYSSFIDE